MEARGSWQKANIAPTRLTALGATGTAVSSDTTAAFAEDSKGDVPAPASVLRPAPVQDDRGLIDGRDHISRS